MTKTRKPIKNSSVDKLKGPSVGDNVSSVSSKKRRSNETTMSSQNSRSRRTENTVKEYKSRSSRVHSTKSFSNNRHSTFQLNKTYKLIILAVILVILVSVFKKNKHEEYLQNATLGELLSDSPTGLDNNATPLKTKTIDFSECDPDDSYEDEMGYGTVALTIFGTDEAGAVCQVETSMEIGGQFNKNECEVPVSVGSVSFAENDFSVISRYCSYKAI